jgi:hypothetical protein
MPDKCDRDLFVNPGGFRNRVGCAAGCGDMIECWARGRPTFFTRHPINLAKLHKAVER